ncbi:PBP1 and LysM peptidoglycan-binding domain-containing protein [Flavivirga rizhaonensis]|uniref:LysM peptidoglycan-binding domain-containing protein n=1 Tax=Flavivirga rizhaonensis TaxID=2559571 RepID=A0A4S1E214_9FLAO|nr:LysM peptidoglycan-binding domain-containing protein [Flavivirga rizhaonensis]TGV04751.1 LysM peptidoglycan-binding domain-containing protein [Flavivirga rizhaonensis]
MNKSLFVLCLLLLFSFGTAQAQNYSAHKVKQGETIESIAKKYLVTPSDIYGLNPDAQKELRVNSVLIIPKSKVLPPKVTTVKELEGYKKHRTKKRQTLYSLSQKYNVTIEEIKKHNTFLYAEPLRKGDKLQIPIFKVTEVEEANKLTKTYTVLPKEGKWRIAYKFGITVKELEELNPEMGDVLQEGQVLNVPNIGDEEEKEIDEKYSYYKVLPKEGFYRLKLKLGLEQEALETLNPVLKDGGLKVGMVLKIPYSSLPESIIGQDAIKVNLVDSIADFNTKHIVVMLPFRLNHVDFDSASDIKKSIEKDPYLDASLDFHSGVLMAIDSLKKLGVSLKVDVYDTKYELGEVKHIMDRNNFENVDAVIGPLTPDNFEEVASELKKYNTPVISPIGTNLKLYNNVFQSRPSNDLLKKRVINFVKADTLASNIIVISDTKNKPVSDDIKREFNFAKQILSRKDKEGVDKYYVNKGDIQDELKPGKNIVFLETQDAGFVSNVTSILAALIQEENIQEKKEAIEIVLVTTNINSAFKDDEVDNTHLSELQFHFATMSRAYNENGNNAFVKRYNQIYNITPNNRAVKGFDLTMDVVLRLVSSEDIYMSVNEAPLTEYVENKFAYKKKLFGGYYNNTVYLVKYDDLEIVEVKQIISQEELKKEQELEESKK